MAMRQWIFGSVLVFVMGIVTFPFWYHFTKPTYVFLIPKGYHGWVQVLYEVPDARQPAKQWNNKYLIRVPRNGIAMTPLNASDAHIETYYVDQNGNRTPILDDHDARAKDPKGVYVRYFVSQGDVRYFASKTVSLPQRDLFFIGTREEFDRVVHQIGQPDFPPYPPEIRKKYSID
jgi:hypothetical protein